MKKKTHKKVVRRKRRSMREKRVMRLKRGLMKRAKKLHLGARRTGAYVYGTLRRIVGNPGKELTLWGYNPKPSYGHLTGPIRLAEYRSQKQQDEYNKEGWITGVYAKGDEPVGLKLKVEEMRRRLRGNPMRSFASLHPTTKATLNKFLDYVYGFYGKGGLDARDFKNGGFDRKTIERAIMVYIDDVRKGKAEWGDGDSVDRERVRMILQPSYSMFIPKGKVTIRKNPYVVKEGKNVLERFDTRREARDYVRASMSRIYNFGTGDLNERFRRMDSLKMRYVRKNPPMYAHRMMSHRTHGLSLKQMMKLYRLVSSGNPKAVMFARRTLGIPMSESLSQVKAVVYHHILDLKGKI